MSNWIKLTTESGNKALFNLDHVVSIGKLRADDPVINSVLTLPSMEECYVQETVEDIYATLAAYRLSVSVS